AYLKRHGRPREPADLLQHNGLVLVTSGGEHQTWRLSKGSEKWEGLPKHALTSNSIGLHQALAVQGVGIVGLSARFARRGVEEGALEPVLADWCLPSHTV